LGKAIRRVAVVAASGLLLILGLTVVTQTIQLAFLMSTIPVRPAPCARGCLSA
jgi:hypothetical protein